MADYALLIRPMGYELCRVTKGSDVPVAAVENEGVE
jgi:hypothetical protein